MRSFSNDRDIARFEPGLFWGLYQGNSVIASATGGVLAGTTYTAAGADFITRGVQAGCIVYLKSDDAALEGLFEVVSVDSETRLTVSVIRADTDCAPIAPPECLSGVSARICTYAAQAGDVFVYLCGRFGITAAQAATIPDTSSLRRAETFLAIAVVFETVATREAFGQEYLDKCEAYTTRFMDAMERCRFIVEIDGRLALKSGSEISLARE
jgi:hypothetical protein